MAIILEYKRLSEINALLNIYHIKTLKLCHKHLHDKLFQQKNSHALNTKISMGDWYYSVNARAFWQTTENNNEDYFVDAIPLRPWGVSHKLTGIFSQYFAEYNLLYGHLG